MGWYDFLMIIAWVLFVAAFAVAASLMMGADWREMRGRLFRRGATRRRWFGRHGRI